MESTGVDLVLLLYCFTDENKTGKQFHCVGVPVVGRKHQESRDVPVHQSAEVSDLLLGTFRDWTGSAGRMSSEFRESNNRSCTCQDLFLFFSKRLLWINTLEITALNKTGWSKGCFDSYEFMTFFLSRTVTWSWNNLGDWNSKSQKWGERESCREGADERPWVIVGSTQWQED